MSAGDEPIVVGGPHMITVQLPDRATDNTGRKFSIAPKDPAVPFKEIVIFDGAEVALTWPLSEDWKITIV